MLKEINVPLWNHANCNGALQAQFGPAYTLPTSAICAGAEGRDACDVSDRLAEGVYLGPRTKCLGNARTLVEEAASGNLLIYATALIFSVSVRPLTSKTR